MTGSVWPSFIAATSIALLPPLVWLQPFGMPEPSCLDVIYISVLSCSLIWCQHDVATARAELQTAGVASARPRSQAKDLVEAVLLQSGSILLKELLVLGGLEIDDGGAAARVEAELKGHPLVIGIEYPGGLSDKAVGGVGDLGAVVGAQLDATPRRGDVVELH